MNDIIAMMNSLGFSQIDDLKTVCKRLAESPMDFTVRHKPLKVGYASTEYWGECELDTVYEAVVGITYESPNGRGRLFIHFTDFGQMYRAEYKTEQRIEFFGEKFEVE